ncbi:poly(U)-binding-splicing factor PUF60-like protein [Lates japonicus]|uniref:Poly(U)-binding-splicing factor PUF60-like protein n=1 Tax=Lates japonicus TaxID=270547 RepID=A0AAD3RHQ2_LATJO|nr:poly(U)-binding-splicing factor PUF60-like protein [Lates japonicus]
MAVLEIQANGDTAVSKEANKHAGMDLPINELSLISAHSRPRGPPCLKSSEGAGNIGQRNSIIDQLAEEARAFNRICGRLPTLTRQMMTSRVFEAFEGSSLIKNKRPTTAHRGFGFIVWGP